MRSDSSRRIVVAMSGGVDSSVAAALLKDEGHDVIGISMQLVDYGEVDERLDSCCSIDDLHDARRVADQLSIPFYVVNLKNAFREKVINKFTSEYLSGRTPNPCIICNQRLKFELLLNKARELGAEFLATGHYARISFEKSSNRYQLLKGIDQGKDQSYFLFTITQEQIKSVVFPLGGLKKEDVRGLAQRYGLRVADKEESQEVCFVVDDDYSGFILKRAPDGVKCGDIVDTSGNILGRHNGIHNYTVGQRKGLGIASSEPLYVTGFDVDRNLVIVGEEGRLYSRGLIADDVNWIFIPELGEDITARVKIRYRHEGEDAVITPLDNRSVRVDFSKPVKSVAPGQAAVFYSEDVVMGGGWIREAI